jgi:hypothetical protein
MRSGCGVVPNYPAARHSFGGTETRLRPMARSSAGCDRCGATLRPSGVRRPSSRCLLDGYEEAVFSGIFRCRRVLFEAGWYVGTSSLPVTPLAA